MCNQSKTHLLRLRRGFCGKPGLKYLNFQGKFCLTLMAVISAYILMSSYMIFFQDPSDSLWSKKIMGEAILLHMTISFAPQDKITYNVEQCQIYNMCCNLR